ALEKGDEVRISYQVGKFYGDEMTINEISEYIKDKNYKEQLYPYLEIPDPVRPDGMGVIQFRDWDFKDHELPPGNSSFFHFLDRAWILQADVNSKEIWTAQEDLWVQKELYRLIRQANEQIANFQCQGGEGLDTFIYNGPEWRLDVKINKDGRL